MNRAVGKVLTHEELADRFITINTGVTVTSWTILKKDDCDAFADKTQPKIRVELQDGNWLRVYVDKEYREITWY